LHSVLRSALREATEDSYHDVITLITCVMKNRTHSEDCETFHSKCRCRADIAVHYIHASACGVQNDVDKPETEGAFSGGA